MLGDVHLDHVHLDHVHQVTLALVRLPRMADITRGDGYFSRRRLLKAGAAIGGSSTLSGWFPFLKFQLHEYAQAV
jgi:hypothetical protein